MPTTEYAVDQFFQNAGTSPKMVYDVAGTLVWSPHNAVTQSQTFDAWSPSNVTVVANQAVAPDGTTTMDKVYPTTSGSNRWVSIPVTSSAVVYTYSVYAKAAGKSWIYFLKFDGSNFGAWFDLQNGVVGNKDASFTSSSIQAVGNGIYRCSVTGMGQVSLSNPIGLCDANGSGSVTVNATDGVYLWGAQLNRGTVPTAYLPTTTAARVGLALDYDPVTHAARGLLCEPAATNTATYSSDFDNAGWGKTLCTLAVNAIAAPNGLAEAEAVIPNAGSVRPYLNKAATTTAATVTTFSVFAKNGTLGSNWIEVQLDASPTIIGWFNLSTGVKGTSSGSPISYTMTAVGNGWYRLAVTFTAGTTSTTPYLAPDAADGSSTGLTGNGTSSAFYLWGAQMEAGTVATSPIPTLAATVTRAADQVNVTTTSINYSATAGSWWIETNPLVVIGSSSRLIGYQTGDNAVIYMNSATQFGLYDGVALILTTVTNTIAVNKVACAFASADRALTANGIAPTIDTTAGTALLSPGTAIGIGGSFSGTNVPNYVRKVRYLPRRPSNAELQTMTT